MPIFHWKEYCEACFKQNPGYYMKLDEDGRCPIHGGRIGQELGLTRTKKGLLLVGGLALFFGVVLGGED